MFPDELPVRRVLELGFCGIGPSRPGIGSKGVKKILAEIRQQFCRDYRIYELTIAELEDVIPIAQKVKGQGKAGAQEISKPPAPDRLAQIIQDFLRFCPQPKHERKPADGETVFNVKTDSFRPAHGVTLAELG